MRSDLRLTYHWENDTHGRIELLFIFFSRLFNVHPRSTELIIRTSRNFENNIIQACSLRTMAKDRFLDEMMLSAQIQGERQFVMLYSKRNASQGGDYSSAETEMRRNMIELKRSETERFEEQVKDWCGCL